MSVAAGQSAQREYQRRRTRDADRRRRGLRKSVVLVVVAALAGYFTVQLFAELFTDQMRSLQDSFGGAPSDDDALDPDTVHVLGLALGGVFALVVLKTRFGVRQSTEAWGVGAAGERMTASALERLPDSYRVLHDLPMPGSKANIDHVVVGPAGIFTVETKNYKRGVVIKGGKAYGNGRKLDKVVAQARRQAEAITALTGTMATPIVCVHGKGVSPGNWRQRPVVDGVRFASGGRLARSITDLQTSLAPETVEEYATMLERIRRSS